MPKVSKAQAGDYAAAETTYRDAINALNSELVDFNESTQVRWEQEVLPLITTVNESISNLRTVAEECADDLQSSYDERSEKWQQSDKGIAFESWVDSWRSVEHAVDEVELECHQYDEVEEATLEAEVEMEYGF